MDDGRLSDRSHMKTKQRNIRWLSKGELGGVAIATRRRTRKRRGHCTQIEQICTLAKPASILHHSGGSGSFSFLYTLYSSTHCLDFHFSWTSFFSLHQLCFSFFIFLFVQALLARLFLLREMIYKYSIINQHVLEFREIILITYTD